TPSNDPANTPAPGSGAVISSGTYRYKITFIDANGNETRDSDPITVTLGGTQNTVTLNGLPAVPDLYTKMRIYRTRADRPFDYSLAGVVPKGAEADPFEDVPAIPDIGSIPTPTFDEGGSMAPGQYQYTFVFHQAADS